MKKQKLLLIALGFVFATSSALADDKLPVKLGGFVDTYFAYDFNKPSPPDRSYATSVVRHNEFNINLAYLDAVIDSSKVRGRAALQAGTSVQANYAAEPTLGTNSGPLLSRHIQEAFAGYQVFDKFWIDAGIYFSHIGWENWISRDNWLYTRSVMADNSPYYQSGVRFSYEFSKMVSAQLHLINGWQNVSETGTGKAGGVQVRVTPINDLTVTYNNFLGTEVGQLYRFFNEVWVKYMLMKGLQVAFLFDHGMQQTAGKGSWSNWWGTGVQGRYQLLSDLALAARLEAYSDPDQVIITTGLGHGYTAQNLSVGADVTLHKQLVWRNEVRLYRGKNSMFPNRTGTSVADFLAVTSLGLSI
ncbi:MAG: porin [Bacteriovoracia bacterium]